MSRDSQARKDFNTGNPRSGRRQGEPNFSLNDKAAHNDQEEVIQIPKDKVGHVIGKKGWRKKDIVEQSGVQALVIKDDQVRLTGTEEQRAKAKMIIYEIIRVRLGKMSFYLTLNHSSFHPLPSFSSAIYLPVCLSACLPVRLSACLSGSIFGIHLYACMDGERHCEMKMSCPKTQLSEPS